MDKSQSLARSFVALVLRVALVAALIAAVWSVYSRLPHEEIAYPGAREEQHSETTLHIRLRVADISFPVSASKIPVQLFPINMAAARNEFDSERRPGQRFEDFVTRQMGDRKPLATELDERGEAAVAVPPGKWWIHATLDGARELTWRLGINVSGREMNVDLTSKNVYTLAKKF